MEEPIMITSRPRFDGTMNLGQLVNSGLLLAILGVFVSLIQWKTDVDANMREDKDFREKSLPIIESIVRNDGIQDQRLNTVGEAITAIRTSQTSLLDKVGDIKASVAVIEERTKKDHGLQ